MDQSPESFVPLSEDTKKILQVVTNSPYAVADPDIFDAEGDQYKRFALPEQPRLREKQEKDRLDQIEDILKDLKKE